MPFIIPLVWNLKQRPRAVYYALFLSGVFLMSNGLKTTFHQPRPFWTSTGITPYGCSTQFGNPSGHSLTSMAAALAVWLDFNYCCEKKKISEDSFLQSQWVRRALLLLALTFAWTVAYSRIVLGMHSYN
jgi:membrane-associated phospholipid phosphatase